MTSTRAPDFLQQRQRRLLHQAGVDLALPQRFQEIDAHGGEPDLAGVGAGLLQQIERERMIGIAEPGYADGLAFELLDVVNRVGGLRRGDQRKQRQPAGDGEAADVGADIGVGGERDVERGRGIVDRAADQRLHGGAAAAGIDQLDVEAVVLEVPVERATS